MTEPVSAAALFIRVSRLSTVTNSESVLSTLRCSCIEWFRASSYTHCLHLLRSQLRYYHGHAAPPLQRG
jgi:hypothetical protein